MRTTDTPPHRLFVTIHRPRCPECDGDDLQTQRSIDNGDGTRTRITVCRSCDCHFDVVVE